ncbi:hypothetical protein [Saccharomonospora piscinae]|uniref:hypothetical protein n=1 Tax=Saccharomonospora piscinae TaxID=687388 RepID=UPI001106D624|nr:hypothetical protein [Saccharomonospora piscinae]TLW91347.1 hypothetical protein FFT09_19075 [Saccharomonospora piscinae]
MAGVRAVAAVLPAHTDPADLTHALARLAAETAPGDTGRAGASIALPVTHLWCVLAQVSRADRREFLFHCWRHWTRGMRPAERVALATRSAAEAGTAGRVVHDVQGRTRLTGSWLRYYDEVADFARSSRTAGTAPLGYVLFTHVREAHRVLAIPAAASAVGAGALRAALATSGEPKPTVRCGHGWAPSNATHP